MTREEIKQIVIETLLEVLDDTNEKIEKEHGHWLGYCDAGWTNFYALVQDRVYESQQKIEGVNTEQPKEVVGSKTRDTTLS